MALKYGKANKLSPADGPIPRLFAREKKGGGKREKICKRPLRCSQASKGREHGSFASSPLILTPHADHFQPMSWDVGMIHSSRIIFL